MGVLKSYQNHQKIDVPMGCWLINQCHVELDGVYLKILQIFKQLKTDWH